MVWCGNGWCLARLLLLLMMMMMTVATRLEMMA